MKKVFLTIACFALGGMTSQARTEEWTQFRGRDFMRTSVKNIAPQWNSEGVEWKTPLPGRGASSPVVFNDHIYLTAFTGYAIDGREPGDPSKLVRHLLCFDVNTGEVVYEHRLQPSAKEIYATPLLADGRLYYVSRENGIFVVAAKPDFALLAHTRLEGDETPFAASPVPLAGGAVLLRSDRFLYRMKSTR
jgi:outer membrane protein assembly factor BamB